MERGVDGGMSVGRRERLGRRVLRGGSFFGCAFSGQLRGGWGEVVGGAEKGYVRHSTHTHVHTPSSANRAPLFHQLPS